MELDAPQALLGGLSPHTFMARYWQKKPLLVRQAMPGVAPPLTPAALFELAASDAVESRLVESRDGGWHVRQGPLPRRALPPLSRAGWTLLVQGLDLHVPAAHALLRAFDFLPAARLDDVMVSWASPGGGVGAHVDAYDVFLLQVQGARRWRVGRVRDASLVEGAPLKLLQNFEASQEWLLQPGDMLYLPPGWGHDGVAEAGACMTCSIGLRAPAQGELARELLMRLADDREDDDGPAARALYRDPRQPATAHPAALPDALLDFARAAVLRQLADPDAMARVLGEHLTEPKPQVWFTPGTGGDPSRRGVRLDARTRMLYDARHVFINGDALRASGRDARLMRLLADARRLDAGHCARLSPPAAALLGDWCAAGWTHLGEHADSSDGDPA